MRTYFQYRPTKSISIYNREEIERLLIACNTKSEHPAESSQVEWREDGSAKVTIKLKPVFGVASKIGTMEEIQGAIK